MVMIAACKFDAINAAIITQFCAALGQPDAEFREGQWDSIDALLNRRRLLVVERTGWGNDER